MGWTQTSHVTKTCHKNDDPQKVAPQRAPRNFDALEMDKLSKKTDNIKGNLNDILGMLNKK